MTDFIQITAISHTPGLADAILIIRKSDIKAIYFPPAGSQKAVIIEIPESTIETRETLSYFQTVLNVYNPADTH